MASHPTPWTAFYVTDERQFHLLDLHGTSIGTISDEDVARRIVKLVNTTARDKAAVKLADVIPLAVVRTADAPPAPDPSKGAATTLDQLFDHLIYLLDEGDYKTLRRRLFDFARATVGLPLPDTFAADDSPGDDHA